MLLTVTTLHRNHLVLIQRVINNSCCKTSILGMPYLQMDKSQMSTTGIHPLNWTKRSSHLLLVLHIKIQSTLSFCPSFLEPLPEQRHLHWSRDICTRLAEQRHLRQSSDICIRAVTSALVQTSAPEQRHLHQSRDICTRSIAFSFHH